MSFINKLVQTIEEWNKKPMEDEWYLEKFKEEMVYTLSAEEAFQAIDNTIDLLSKQRDDATIYDLLEIILSLVKKSDTTEIPKKLLEKKDIIIDKIKRMGDDGNIKGYTFNRLNELFMYYHLPKIL